MSTVLYMLTDRKMMRYRGKYQRSAYPAIVIEPSDEGEILEEKWRSWSEQEGWKRYVLHARPFQLETN